jgi:hypothetical protein
VSPPFVALVWPRDDCTDRQSVGPFAETHGVNASPLGRQRTPPSRRCFDVRRNPRWWSVFVVVFLAAVAGCGRSAEKVEVVAETTSDCPAPTSWTRISSDSMTATEIRRAIQARLADNGIIERCSFALREAEGFVEFSASDPAIATLATSSGQVQFKEVLEVLNSETALSPGVPTDANGMAYRLGEPLASGNIVATAEAAVGSTGMWQISVVFTESGAADFDRIAELVYQRQLAIVMDEQVLSAPVIQTRRFAGRAEISGNFSASEAKALASALSHPLVGTITVELAPGSSSNS